jgi:hypothetical protein
MFVWSISLCILFLLVTAVVHSVGGERYLLKPLFKYRGNRVLESDLARVVLRFAWHLTSLLWILLAALLYVYAFHRDHLGFAMLIGIGCTFSFAGLFDAVASKGRHIGWPLLLMIGVFAFLASTVA